MVNRRWLIKSVIFKIKRISFPLPSRRKKRDWIGLWPGKNRRDPFSYFYLTSKIDFEKLQFQIFEILRNSLHVHYKYINLRHDATHISSHRANPLPRYMQNASINKFHIQISISKKKKQNTNKFLFSPFSSKHKWLKRSIPSVMWNCVIGGTTFRNNLPEAQSNRGRTRPSLINPRIELETCTRAMINWINNRNSSSR